MKIGDQTLRDGLVKSKCRHGRRYWDFYATGNWDREKDRELAGSSPSYWFEVNRILVSKRRTGETVTFGTITFTFANEDDAVNFTGEARDLAD